jgi:hypothetical protein
MHICHMTRSEVAQALDELMRARVVQSFADGSRYAVRLPICLPATTPACNTELADDTHQLEQRQCAGVLSAFGHIGASA